MWWGKWGSCAAIDSGSKILNDNHHPAPSPFEGEGWGGGAARCRHAEPDIYEKTSRRPKSCCGDGYAINRLMASDSGGKHHWDNLLSISFVRKRGLLSSWTAGNMRLPLTMMNNGQSALSLSATGFSDFGIVMYLKIWTGCWKELEKRYITPVEASPPSLPSPSRGEGEFFVRLACAG